MVLSRRLNGQRVHVPLGGFMTRHSNAWLRHITAAVCGLLLSQFPLVLFAQSGQPVQLLSANQLNDLVAPIALYPDALVSQVLVASTYPLELVQAEQWLQRKPPSQQQNWDPSVQALLTFPDVLQRLNADITWTTNLGKAFLTQQPDVMNAIQRIRLSAQQSGKMVSTSQQEVLTTTEAGQTFVTIVPVDPNVVYVPMYDPEWFWGPAVYYTYPRWYFVPRAGLSFGVGIPLTNGFIERYHFNSARLGIPPVRLSPVRPFAPHRFVVPHTGHAFLHGVPARPSFRAP